MLQWDKSFETNIESVDSQHQYLIELINDLNKEVIAQMEYDNYDRIMEILTELKNYTISHFKQEEQLMKDIMSKLSDEGLAQFWLYFKNHRAEHVAFINKIEQIFNKDIDDNQAEISLDLINFLVDWLKNHILKIDLQLCKYV